VVKIPLVIFEPGRKERLDIHANTSGVDVLPTLLHLNQIDTPDWAEGRLLPPFGGDADLAGRGIFAVNAKYNKWTRPLTESSFMILKDQYKLTYYQGYQQLDKYQVLLEMFDVVEDPEELEDLSVSEPAVTDQLRDELVERWQKADKDYLK